MDCSPSGSSVHGDFPGKITGVGCHFLLQGIFSTQGLNTCPLNTPILAGGVFFFLPLTPPGKTNSQLNWSSTLACGRWGSSPPKLPQGYTMGSGVYWMLGRCICQDRLGFALVTHKLWPCFSNSKGLFLAYTVCLLGSLCRVFSLQDPDWWSCHLKCGLWLWLRERKHKKLLSSS